jgi:hypothetical protein
MTELQTLETLKTSAVAKPNDDAPMSLMTGAGFRQLQRVATALSSSTMVPVQYRAFTEVKEFGKVTGYLDNPAGLPNCIVALNMAIRMNADPLMIMQNLHVIEGRPSWSSQFIIAMLNSSGKFSPLRFELSKPGEEETIEYTVNVWTKGNKSIEKRTTTFRHQSCVAWVIEKETGERLQSPTVTMAMARDEGWIGKNGSKWQTMQEVMLQYRTASLLGRFYAPELLMGLQSREEVEDFIEATPDGTGNYAVDLDDLRNREPKAPPVVDDEAQAEVVNTETGEIKEKKTRKPRAKTEESPKEEASAEAENPEEAVEEVQAASTDELPDFD